MINNKKGLSMIVSTLIIILLVLVAVGVIWVVVNNLIQEGTDTIEISQKCLDVNIQATKVVGNGTEFNYNVTLLRAAGGEAIAGVKLSFTDATGTSNALVDYNGNIAPLDRVTITNLDGTALANNATKVEVTAYFEDDSGVEQLCSQSTDYSFTLA